MTRFYALELDISRPGGSRIFSKAWATTPWPTWGRRPTPLAVTDTLRASDVGYRTREADAGGLKTYPALISEAFSVERAINIDPVASTIGAAAAQIVLANPSGQLDTIIANWNVDGRAARVYAGLKVYDPVRGYWDDPAKADLVLAFAGLARPWYADTGLLNVPLRDPTYWLELALQANQFGGTGGYDGMTGLAGTRKPKLRGGTSLNPVRNISPVLIATTPYPTYLVSDAPGGIANVYEAGYPGAFTFQTNTSNLFAGSTNSGQYRTDTGASGLLAFQLGAPAQGEITCDAWGDFPTAGAVSAAPDVARYLMLEDCGVPSGNVLASSFTAAASAYPYTAGVYFHPDDQVTGVEALDRVLQPIGGRIFMRRHGQLALLVLRALATGATPVANFTRNDAMAWEPEQADPPAWRTTLAWKKNWTRQTTGISALATAAQKAFIASAGEAVAWFSSAVTAAYARPRDISIDAGTLLVAAHAQACVNGIGGMFGTPRIVGWLEVPTEVGLAREIGDIVRLTWPTGDLRNGRVGQVIGDRVRSQDGTMRLRLLF